MTLSFIAHAVIKPVQQWEQMELNKAQVVGTKVHELMPDSNGDDVNLQQVKAKVKCWNGSEVCCVAGENNTAGFFNEAGGGKKSVEKAVKEYLSWPTTAALVSVRDIVLGFVKEDDRIYAFDFTPPKVDGTPTITRLESTVDSVCGYLNHYCPTRGYDKSFNSIGWYRVQIRSMTRSDETPRNQNRGNEATAVGSVEQDVESTGVNRDSVKESSTHEVKNFFLNVLRCKGLQVFGNWIRTVTFDLNVVEFDYKITVWLQLISI